MSSLRALARMMVRDDHSAEDLVQEAWVTALRRPAKPGWTSLSWLTGILRNHARRRARSEHRRVVCELAAARSEVGPVDSAVGRLELLNELITQVRALEEPYRSTIVLRFFDGLSPREIGERQGVPPATVRTRQKRGIEQLRARMDLAHRGDRRAWLLPLLPFATVADPTTTAILTEAAGELARAGGRSLLGMSSRQQVVALLGLLLTGAAAATQWPDSSTAPPIGTLTVSSTEAVQRGSSADSEPLADPTADDLDRRRDVVDPGEPSGQARLLLRVAGTASSRAGAPLAGVTVAFNRATTTTASDGSYSVEVPARRGNRTLEVRSVASLPGYVTGVESVCFSLAEPRARLDLTLQPALLVSGLVVDREGRGIAGALVEDSSQPPCTVRTGADGGFRLDAVDPTVPRQLVKVSADGFLDQVQELFSTRVAEPTDLHLVLLRGASVHGSVRGPGGEAIAGAHLSLATGERTIELDSDANGAFEFTAAAGPARLSVVHPEFAPLALGLTVPEAGRQLELSPQLLPGRVCTGTVHDGSGQPILATVQVHYRRRLLSEARAGRDGRFELRGLPPAAANDEALLLTCRAEGFLPQTMPIPPTAEVTLQRCGQLAGTVVDAATGRPVQGFTIRRVGRRPEGPQPTAVWSVGRRFVNAKGAFAITDLGVAAATAIDVEVQAPGFATTVARDLRASTRPLPGEHRIALQPGASLEGTVLTADGMPLPHALLHLSTAQRPLDLGARAGRGNVTVRADAEGRFLFTDLPAGACLLAVEHPAWGLFLHEVWIAAGAGRQRQVVQLESQGSLEALVSTADGRPAAAAEVRLTAVDVRGLRSYVLRARTEANGAVSFRHLPCGTYQVTALLPGSATAAAQQGEVQVQVGVSTNQQVLVGLDARPQRSR